MMNHRRINRLRKTLKVEALEDRMLLSGNALAWEDPALGMLHINGDNANNAITIKQVLPDVIRVSGNVILPAPPLRPDVTSIDGTTFQEYFLDSINAIDIQMLNGNNKLSISGLSIPGNLTIH